jgi:hypothetical protein
MSEHALLVMVTQSDMIAGEVSRARFGQLRTSRRFTQISSKRTSAIDLGDLILQVPCAQFGNFNSRITAWKRGSLRNGSMRGSVFK